MNRPIPPPPPEFESIFSSQYTSSNFLQSRTNDFGPEFSSYSSFRVCPPQSSIVPQTFSNQLTPPPRSLVVPPPPYNSIIPQPPPESHGADQLCSPTIIPPPPCWTFQQETLSSVSNHGSPHSSPLSPLSRRISLSNEHFAAPLSSTYKVVRLQPHHNSTTTVTSFHPNNSSSRDTMVCEKWDYPTHLADDEEEEGFIPYDPSRSGSKTSEDVSRTTATMEVRPTIIQLSQSNSSAVSEDVIEHNHLWDDGRLSAQDVNDELWDNREESVEQPAEIEEENHPIIENEEVSISDDGQTEEGEIDDSPKVQPAVVLPPAFLSSLETVQSEDSTRLIPPPPSISLAEEKKIMHTQHQPMEFSTAAMESSTAGLIHSPETDAHVQESYRINNDEEISVISDEEEEETTLLEENDIPHSVKEFWMTKFKMRGGPSGQATLMARLSSLDLSPESSMLSELLDVFLPFYCNTCLQGVTLPLPCELYLMSSRIEASSFDAILSSLYRFSIIPIALQLASNPTLGPTGLKVLSKFIEHQSNFPFRWISLNKIGATGDSLHELFHSVLNRRHDKIYPRANPLNHNPGTTIPLWIDLSGTELNFEPDKDILDYLDSIEPNLFCRALNKFECGINRCTRAGAIFHLPKLPSTREEVAIPAESARDPNNHKSDTIGNRPSINLNSLFNETTSIEVSGFHIRDEILDADQLSCVSSSSERSDEEKSGIMSAIESEDEEEEEAEPPSVPLHWVEESPLFSKGPTMYPRQSRPSLQQGWRRDLYNYSCPKNSDTSHISSSPFSASRQDISSFQPQLPRRSNSPLASNSAVRQTKFPIIISPPQFSRPPSQAQIRPLAPEIECADGLPIQYRGQPPVYSRLFQRGRPIPPPPPSYTEPVINSSVHFEPLASDRLPSRLQAEHQQLSPALSLAYRQLLYDAYLSLASIAVEQMIYPAEFLKDLFELYVKGCPLSNLPSLWTVSDPDSLARNLVSESFSGSFALQEAPASGSIVDELSLEETNEVTNIIEDGSNAEWSSTSDSSVSAADLLSSEGLSEGEISGNATASKPLKKKRRRRVYAFRPDTYDQPFAKRMRVSPLDSISSDQSPTTVNEESNQSATNIQSPISSSESRIYDSPTTNNEHSSSFAEPSRGRLSSSCSSSSPTMQQSSSSDLTRMPGSSESQSKVDSSSTSNSKQYISKQFRINGNVNNCETSSSQVHFLQSSPNSVQLDGDVQLIEDDGNNSEDDSLQLIDVSEVESEIFPIQRDIKHKVFRCGKFSKVSGARRLDARSFDEKNRRISNVSAEEGEIENRLSECSYSTQSGPLISNPSASLEELQLSSDDIHL